jgi:threonine/homoserine/homoserine lactone efflux protein
MPTELFAGLIVFAVATLYTPGPNNLMLMASGLNFGFGRTRPHLAGVAIGFGLMVLIVGLGLGSIFDAYPALYTVLKFVGGGYLLYLAWRIATAAPSQGTEPSRGKPMTFLQAAAFQWVNAKAWVMAIGAATAYAALNTFPYNMAIIAGVFALIGLTSSLTWVVFGIGLKRLVTNSRAVRVFNIVMALALVASLYPVFFGHAAG